jgi:hypothetical protein
MQTVSTTIMDTWATNPYREISISGDYRTTPTYFELFVISASDEKIILASGYTGAAGGG